MPVLFFAVRRGEPEEVHRLLLAGADPDAALPSSVSSLPFSKLPKHSCDGPLIRYCVKHITPQNLCR